MSSRALRNRSWPPLAATPDGGSKWIAGQCRFGQNRSSGPATLSSGGDGVGAAGTLRLSGLVPATAGRGPVRYEVGVHAVLPTVIDPLIPDPGAKVIAIIVMLVLPSPGCLMMLNSALASNRPSGREMDSV